MRLIFLFRLKGLGAKRTFFGIIADLRKRKYKVTINKSSLIDNQLTLDVM